MLAFNDSINTCITSAAKNGVTYNSRVLLIKRVIDAVIENSNLTPRAKVLSNNVDINYQLQNNKIIIHMKGCVDKKKLTIEIEDGKLYKIDDVESSIIEVSRCVIQLLLRNNQSKTLYC